MIEKNSAKIRKTINSLKFQTSPVEMLQEDFPEIVRKLDRNLGKIEKTFVENELLKNSKVIREYIKKDIYKHLTS